MLHLYLFSKNLYYLFIYFIYLVKACIIIYLFILFI